MAEGNNMLGKDLYRIEVNAELSNERLRSLVFFYGPLIGNEALAFYEYLVLKGNTFGFSKLNELLVSLNLSIDRFEKNCDILNEFRLLSTLRRDDHYIFIFNGPLTMKEFIRDDVFVRHFIMKTSGAHYQELLAEIREDNDHKGFENISKTLKAEELSGWSSSDETYIRKQRTAKKTDYDFGTMFDVNVFLKDISPTLFPMRFRTPEILQKIAVCADLYDVSYDRMRVILAEVADFDSDEFDLRELEKACMRSNGVYREVEKGQYDVPCVTFLMSLQNGKEVTESDRYVLRNLSDKYHLPAPVINVLVEYGLKNCDNRLVEKYLTKTAADLHRNDIDTAEKALKWLDKPAEKKTVSEDRLPIYDPSSNPFMTKEDEEELLKLMGKK